MRRSSTESACEKEQVRTVKSNYLIVGSSTFPVLEIVLAVDVKPISVAALLTMTTLLLVKYQIVNSLLLFPVKYCGRKPLAATLLIQNVIW